MIGKISVTSQSILHRLSKFSYKYAAQVQIIVGGTKRWKYANHSSILNSFKWQHHYETSFSLTYCQGNLDFEKLHSIHQMQTNLQDVLAYNNKLQDVFVSADGSKDYRTSKLERELLVYIKPIRVLYWSLYIEDRSQVNNLHCIVNSNGYDVYHHQSYHKWLYFIEKNQEF